LATYSFNRAYSKHNPVLYIYIYNFNLKNFRPKRKMIKSGKNWEMPRLQQYKKTRLAIFSYDSNGLLESLSLKVSTVTF